MPKLTWDKFVETYPHKGHLVTTSTSPASFKKPVGISPKNQKSWPTVMQAFNLALGGKLTGNWAYRNQKVPVPKSTNPRVKIHPLTAHYFIFEKSADALLAARLFKRGATALSKCPNSHYASLTKGDAFDIELYKEICKALGYL